MKNTPPFDAPFGVIPELRLSLIPRWSIIDMSKEQSVAEHSANVAYIVNYLCDSLGDYDVVQTQELISDALFHDYDEIFTGDMPTPAKEDSHGTLPPLVKLADLLEAYWFAGKYCIDKDKIKRWVLTGIYNKILPLAEKVKVNYDIIRPFLEGEL